MRGKGETAASQFHDNDIAFWSALYISNKLNADACVKIWIVRRSIEKSKNKKKYIQNIIGIVIFKEWNRSLCPISSIRIHENLISYRKGTYTINEE